MKESDLSLLQTLFYYYLIITASNVPQKQIYTQKKKIKTSQNFSSNISLSQATQIHTLRRDNIRRLETPSTHMLKIINKFLTPICFLEFSENFQLCNLFLWINSNQFFGFIQNTINFEKVVFKEERERELG